MTAGIERFSLGEAVGGKAIIRLKRIKSFCKPVILQPGGSIVIAWWSPCWMRPMSF
jgi:hypothetical protein